jgi:pimeloyl-ACP methyl ester carboxylesterase
MTEQQPGRHELAILDSTMSYVEAGSAGPTVLFLHGNPTSSYIWRNIIPHGVAGCTLHCSDLIGYGQSGKPDIAYRFFDQVRYLDAFIEKMDIRDVVLVAQDWGTALAFHFAARRPQRVVGLAFMEFIQPFARWEDFHQRPQARDLFRAFRTPGQGDKLVLDDNIFIERVLPNSVLRTMTEDEMEAYRAPFPTARDPQADPCPTERHADRGQTGGCHGHQRARSSCTGGIDLSKTALPRRPWCAGLTGRSAYLCGPACKLRRHQSRTRRALPAGRPCRCDRCGVARLDPGNCDKVARTRKSLRLDHFGAVNLAG